MPSVLLNRFRHASLIITGVLVIDILTKWLISRGLHDSINRGGPLWLEHSSNSGLSFGGLSGHSWSVTMLSAVVLAGLVAAIARVADIRSLVALSLIFAGGLSNLLDRLVHSGQVTDFLGVGNWFVCNLADVAISVGVVLLIVQVCTGRKVLR